MNPSITAAIRATLAALPDHFEIIELKLLIPAMGPLARGHPANQLAAEAVAAAAYLVAPIEVEVDAPQLRAAAHAEQVPYRVI